MTIPQKKYKICLVNECLSTGGAERVAARLSVYFESKGIEIHHIIVLDSVVYQYSGKLLNLGKLKNKSNSIFNKWKRFQVLATYIKENDFDFIIDFRVKNHFWQEWIISKWIYTPPIIFGVRSYNLDFYFPRSKALARSIHKKAYGITTNSEMISKKIKERYGLSATTIYNPIDISDIEQKATQAIAFDFEYVVCAGRMNDTVKQFDKLLQSYSQSILPSRNIKLLLLGEGVLKNDLENFAIQLKIEDKVMFVGHQDNPFQYYKKAKFLVLSSAFEGMPNVLLEALACGTPVVSFDCESGPNEIIQNEYNGLLVENQNFEKLTLAMNQMIDNVQLYSKCQSNAKNSCQIFSMDIIGQQWLDYLKINVS